MATNVHTINLSLSLPADLLKRARRRAKTLRYSRPSHYVTFLIDDDIAQGGDHTRVPDTGRLHGGGPTGILCLSLHKTTAGAADRRAAQLGYRKRSHYVAFLFHRDLTHPGPHVRVPSPPKS